VSLLQGTADALSLGVHQLLAQSIIPSNKEAVTPAHRARPSEATIQVFELLGPFDFADLQAAIFGLPAMEGAIAGLAAEVGDLLTGVSSRKQLTDLLFGKLLFFMSASGIICQQNCYQYSGALG
jgi:hypothetical protein